MSETPPPGVWTEDMAEISGFGGGYEECCREMLRAGLRWYAEHPDAKPRFKGFKEVFGLLMEDNEDAKVLSKAVLEPGKAGGGATGAMHQAVIGHLFKIRRDGWEAYVEAMRKPDPPEDAPVP